MTGGIQPFRIEIPQVNVDYLHDRLASASWPGELPGVARTRGIPQAGPRAGRRVLDRVPPRPVLAGDGGPVQLGAGLQAFFGLLR